MAINIPTSRTLPASGLFLLCCLLTVMIYLPGLSGDFMFDDKYNLLDNKALAISSLSAAELEKAAFSSHAGTLRRPISMVSFALNHYFFGGGPFSYKVTNLAIHLLTGFGLFIVGRLILDSYRRTHAPDLSPATVYWLPVILSGLWLVHPLNLSAVLYIVQRMASLSALFMVAGIGLYLFGRSRLAAHRTGWPFILAGYFLFGGLAVLSKETGILLPLFILVLEITLFNFRDASGKADRTVIAFFVIFMALPAVICLLYLAVNAEAYLNYAGREFTLTERLLTESRVLVFYLKMILLPTLGELGLYHDDIRLSSGVLSPPSTLAALLMLAGLLLAAVLLVRKQALISLGILWFFAGHALESTIFPLEIAHEHRNYLADFGILLAVSGMILRAPVKQLAPLVYIATPLIYLLVLSATTWIRSSQWSDNVEHAAYEARHHPESPRAVFAVGRIYARLTLQGHTEFREKAFTYIERANDIDTTSILPAATLVKLKHLLNEPVDPAWYDEINDRLSKYSLTPSDISSLQELADCLDIHCAIPHDIMESFFTHALRDDNPHMLALYGYFTINKQQDFQKGLDIFRHTVEIAPSDPQYWKNLINLLMVMGQFDDAESTLQEFRNLNPLGSNESDFDTLQNDIDTGRGEQAAISTTNAGNGTP